jgi:shikimate kinase
MTAAHRGGDPNLPSSNIPATISLIGMPGAGKSTVGVILAKLTGHRFRDTDLDIQVREQATLQEIVERAGYLQLREIEEQVLLSLPLEQSIISTGGSVVYSARTVERLRAAGPLVYLEVDLPTLEQRVAAAPLRGIASDPGHSFAQVYAERTPLYRRHADFTVNAAQGTADGVAAAILARITGGD